MPLLYLRQNMGYTGVILTRMRTWGLTMGFSGGGSYIIQ